MIRRWQEQVLRTALSVRRGVHLTGARQCGKTTLAEFVAEGTMRHLTLDDPLYLRAAKEDPQGFVTRTDQRALVIDEIQKAPELLNAIKIRLDHDCAPGQYLITGSSNLHFVKAVTDSLAGRLGRVRLRTLALGEINGGTGNFLGRAFARDLPQECPGMGKRDVIAQAFRGGYPEPMNFDDASRRRWFAEYLEDLLTRDIQDVTEIRKVDALRKTATWLLSYSSKFFELKSLCTVAQLTKETAGNYLSALKTLYLFDELPPWSDSDYAKLGKRSKFFATDSGLLANLLGWNEDMAYFDPDISGKLVETWVYHELATLVDLDSGMELLHYRDSAQHEIDFIVRNAKGELLGIEVKAGTVAESDFKHLRWFASHYARTPFTGVVLYAGSQTLRFGEGFYAVPLSALGI